MNKSTLTRVVGQLQNQPIASTAPSVQQEEDVVEGADEAKADVQMESRRRR